MKAIMEVGEPPLSPTLSPAARRTGSRRPAADDELRIKTVLVPLDFSEPSLRAMRWTIPLAETFGAAIHLVHVQPSDELTSISHAGQLMLDCADAIALMQDHLAEIQREHDVRFWPENCHAPCGRPFAEICKLATEIEADLIVLPTHGYTGLKHMVLGGTAERVVRFAPCPVFVLRGTRYENALLRDASAGGRFEPGRIVVPVDFSRCSMAGLRYAARMARSTGASLRLLHVVYPYAQLLGVDRIGPNSKSLVKEARKDAETELARLQGLRLLRGLDCETEIRVGPPTGVIASESAQPGVDLIVTSTHGRSGFERALLGSVTEQLIRYAECPVLSVPSRALF